MKLLGYVSKGANIAQEQKVLYWLKRAKSSRLSS
jgi:hypothetical protein